ncbi:MAG: hypothetical protein PHD55_04800 [Methanoregula sp.]|nr:hypothetical protein [Methanoregula sp.]
MSSVSPIGIPNARGILKNDGTGLLSWTTIQPGKNLIINGDCRVNQRVTAYTLIKDAYTWDASDLYGPDRHEGMATGTAVSAGTWGQTVTATAGHSRYAFCFAGVTLTGAGVLWHRTRIEAKDAVELKNQIASFGCYVWQDTGSAHNYTIYVRKANSADNFSAVTEIGHSAAQSVPSGGSSPGTFIKFEGLSMGDCSNGIEIEIKIECGAVTTKNFEQTELQLELGTVPTKFEFRSYMQEKQMCKRYFQRENEIFTNGALLMFGQVTSAIIGVIIYELIPEMRSSPSLVQNGTLALSSAAGGPCPVTNISISYSTSQIATIVVTASGGGLVAGNATYLYASNSSGDVFLNAEL